MKPASATNWTEVGEPLGLAELSQVCGIPAAELQELVEYRELAPLEPARDPPVFSPDCVAPLRHAAKLRQDYDLDLFTMGLLLGYLNRIDALERQVKWMKTHLPAHVIAEHHEGPELWHEPHAKAQAGGAWPA